MALALTAFFISLTGIAVLFSLKAWEEKKSRKVFPRARAVIDEKAMRLKALGDAGLKDLQKLPQHALHISRVGIHRAAVGFGYLAHWLGKQSHRLADLVSYKHRFERRELRSEFLKKVIEHKNGGGGGSERE